MEVPPEITAIVKEHLGQQAIEMQRVAGRGLWIITPDNQASYILATNLSEVIGEGESDDLAELNRMVETFDLERQVVAIFSVTDSLQYVGVFDVA
jgi:hypothetical protein